MRFTPGWTPDPAHDLAEIARRLPGWPVRKAKGWRNAYEARAPRFLLQVRLRGGKPRLVAAPLPWQQWTVAGAAVGAAVLWFLLVILGAVPGSFPWPAILAQVPTLQLAVLAGVHRKALAEAAAALSRPAEPPAKPAADAWSRLQAPGAGATPAPGAKPRRRKPVQELV